VLFGISIQRPGLALAYAIIVGLGAILGTLVPLLLQHRAQIDRMLLIEVIAGIAVMSIGIALSAWAGKIREHRQNIGMAVRTKRYYAAVFVAVLCGLLAPMLNYSFSFGQYMARTAVLLGNTEVRAAYAVWPIGLAGWRTCAEYWVQHFSSSEEPNWSAIPFWSAGSVLGDTDDSSLDGRVCGLWNECGVSRPFRNIDRMGIVPDHYDHGRNSFGCNYR
jgi:hypothetical protein